MIKFIFDKILKREKVAADFEEIKKHAKIIDYKINQLLNGEIDGVSFDELLIVMREIPDDVFLSERILGHAISDSRKYLVDIDIRERDPEYDNYWREKLQTYSVKLKEIISRDEV